MKGQTQFPTCSLSVPASWDLPFSRCPSITATPSHVIIIIEHTFSCQCATLLCLACPPVVTPGRAQSTCDGDSSPSSHGRAGRAHFASPSLSRTIDRRWWRRFAWRHADEDLAPAHRAHAAGEACFVTVARKKSIMASGALSSVPRRFDTLFLGPARDCLSASLLGSPVVHACTLLL